MSRIHSQHKPTSWGHYLSIYEYTKYIHNINFISVSRTHSQHKPTNWGHYLSIYEYTTIIYVQYTHGLKFDMNTHIKSNILSNY